MPYEGYLEVGGRELANAARTFQYVTDLSAFGLHDCQGCEDLGEALGETYTTPVADPAPWYDPTDSDTGDFYGFYPTQIEGFSTSTRESVNVELVGDGSVQTSQRRAGRDIMVRGAMFAATRAALDKGFSWLDNVLNSQACDGEQATIFSACPEIVTYPPEAFQFNIPDDHSWFEDEEFWSMSSGSLAGGASMEFTWDASDPQKAAWREFTGLIPGERYQLRLRMNGISVRVRIGNLNVTPELNLAENPRWLGSQFDGTIVTPAPAANQFDESDGGPLGPGWRKYVYPSDTAADTIVVVDTDDQDRMTRMIAGDEATVSAYAYAGESSTVDLVVRFFDAAGSQVGVDTTLDSDASNDAWVQLSGLATAPANSVAMQIEVQYATAGAITSGTEFGVWGSLVSPSGSTTYFDGYTDGFTWTSTPDFSSSETEADVDPVTYFDPNDFWSPPVATTVLDFVPTSTSVTLYMDGGSTSGNTLSLHEMQVWRTPEPGVVAFSTNEFDMVSPSDGWTIDPITDATITFSIDQVVNATYEGWLRALILAPSTGGVTVPVGSGPYRASFGLTPGERYRLAISYSSLWQETSADPLIPLDTEPAIDGAIAQTLIHTEDNSGRHQRIIEFIPSGSTVTVRLETGMEVMLGSSGSVDMEVLEVLVEKVFEEPDTSQPDPLTPVQRTLYSVAAISGPQMTNLRRTSCGWMAEATFGLRAGNPGIYREPFLAGGLPTSVSTTVDAIPCVGGVRPRVNFMYNPSVEEALNPIGGRVDYGSTGGAIGRSSAVTPGPVIGDFFVDGFAVDQIVGYYSPGDAVDGPTPGEGGTYTHSVYIAADTTGTYEWLLGLNYVGLSVTVQDTVDLTANVWTRIENTFTIPVGNELSLLEFHHQDTGNISGQLYMDGYMIEPGDTATEVWDDTSEDAEWSGTAQESALFLVEAEEDITVDPDCPVIPLPPQPPSVDVSCVDEPGTYQRSVITISENVVPTNLTAYPILTLQAGAQDVRQARIRFWENPDHLSIDELDPCGFEGDIIVSFLPAGATLVIDGVQRIATMTLGGVTQDATHLLYGSDGGPVDWPELTGGIEYLVTLDLDSTGTFSDTQMNVELVVKD